MKTTFCLQIPYTYICSSVLNYVFYFLGGHQKVQSQLLKRSASSWNTKCLISTPTPYFDLHSCLTPNFDLNSCRTLCFNLNSCFFSTSSGQRIFFTAEPNGESDLIERPFSPWRCPDISYLIAEFKNRQSKKTKVIPLARNIFGNTIMKKIRSINKQNCRNFT